MADTERLLAKFRSISPELLKICMSGRRVLVVTHIDADGLASGSIVFSSLMRKGGNVTLRTVPDLDPKTIKDLAEQKFDFYIFTDLASTLIAELEAALDGRFMIIDHHQLSDEDMRKPSVVNAWACGFDGGNEACSSAMAYFFASSIDPSNSDLSPLAVVGAVADRQDRGDGRSLTGLNRAAMEEALSAGLLAVSKDLMFTGRETRPIYEAVALTSTPLMRGVTGSKDAVLAALHQSGLQLKDGGVWRTISSLSLEEKMKLTEVIAGLLGSAEGATESIAGLVGEVYTLVFEDSFTPLRDAREFGTLLNACGRMGGAGTGIAVCLGDRSEALKAAMKTLADYRSGLNKALQTLSAEPTRTVQNGKLVFVNGVGVIDERMLGPVISILTSSPEFKDKVVVGSASSRDSNVKVSCLVGDSYAGEINLGLVMRVAAESVDGVGGGHTMAAGAKIPAEATAKFLKTVAERIVQ